MPIQTDVFEFVALELDLGSPHNVLVHRADTFFGMSGSPVWLKGAGRDSPGGRKPHSLIGIVEGARGPLLSDKGFHITFSTLITPKVLNRLTRTEFLSSL
jgi:V8-like Glu-specific endopeptidase